MTEKTTLTRVTHLVAKVFVWLSFRQQAAGGPSLRRLSTGSQVDRGEMGGEFPPRSSTVLTAAYWSDIASLLKRDTSPAARAGARGRGAEGAKRSCQTRAQRDVWGGRWWVSFTQLCHTLRCSLTCACQARCLVAFERSSHPQPWCLAAAVRQVCTNRGYFFQHTSKWGFWNGASSHELKVARV